MILNSNKKNKINCQHGRCQCILNFCKCSHFKDRNMHSWHWNSAVEIQYFLSSLKFVDLG